MLQSVAGRTTRPTSDRVREAIFNILGANVREAVVLDLFAGTGALGLEALSRGAQRAVFVDHQRAAVSVINKNVVACKLVPQTQIFRWPLQKNLNVLKSAGLHFDLIFMDPPYSQGFIQPVLSHLRQGCFVAANGMLIVEHALSEPLDTGGTGFQIQNQRRYGKTLVSFLNYML